MLLYKNRLVKKNDFERIYRKGNFFSFNNISLKINKNEENITRIGFSVGVKFSKKAVERNKIKRQLRVIIGKNLENIKTGFDIIIIPKKQEKNKITNKELEKNLINVLRKSKLII